MNEFLGNRKAVITARKWLNSFKWKKKPLLLGGPNGCGKSSLAILVLLEKGFEVVDVLREEEKSISSLKKTNEEKCSPSFKVSDRVRDVVTFGQKNGTLETFFEEAPISKPQALLIDDIDTINPEERIKTIETIFGKGKVRKRVMSLPIIFTCDDPFKIYMKSLKEKCEFVALYSHYKRDMLIMYKRVVNNYPHLSNNGFPIINQCNGDMRKMLNLTQFFSKKSGKIFESKFETNSLYKSPFEAALKSLLDPRVSLSSSRVQTNRNLVLALIRNNYLNCFYHKEVVLKGKEKLLQEVKCLDALADAAEVVSQSDIMTNQNEEFENILLCANIGKISKPFLRKSQNPTITFPVKFFAAMKNISFGEKMWKSFGNVNNIKRMTGWSNGEKYIAAKILKSHTNEYRKNIGFNTSDAKNVFDRVGKFEKLVNKQ